MPSIFRFYLIHCAIGFAVSACFTGLILWFNVANLWHLISTSDIGVMALTVYWVLNGIVFAGVQMGIAIMSMARKDDEGPRGGLRLPVPVTVRQSAQPR